MPLWTKKGIYITLFALPYQAIDSESAVRRGPQAVSNTRINALSVTLVRRTAAWTLTLSVPKQNRILFTTVSV